MALPPPQPLLLLLLLLASRAPPTRAPQPPPPPPPPPLVVAGAFADAGGMVNSGSTSGKWPEDDELAAWGKRLLKLPAADALFFELTFSSPSSDDKATLKSDDEGKPGVGPAEWFACRPGSGPCNPKPRWKPTYNMSESTSMQVCNFSGYQNPSSIRKWGLVDFDWENARGDLVADGWSKTIPMDCGERMTKQVDMMLAAYPESTSKYMVYRNFVKALPWLTVVREKLSDPDRAYDAWFLNFSAVVQANHSASHVPVCDNDYNPPLCSHLYHDQLLTPGNGKDGNGKSGVCDRRCGVGSVPVGEYLFDFRSANVSVKGQTMADWFVEQYMLGSSGAGNDNIVGYYIDDGWAADAASNAHGPSECDRNWQADTGLTAAEVDDEIAAFRWVADKVYATMIERGKFNWNQFLNNDPNCPACGNCPAPWVLPASCAVDLRQHCNATGPVHTRAMHYGIRGCGVKEGPYNYTSNLTDIGPHVANFLLVRGEYAWLSTGWSGCGSADRSHHYGWNAEWLDKDYGEPTEEVCHESSPGSGVFERKWTKGVISMDCNSWEPKWTPKLPRNPTLEQSWPRSLAHLGR
jgi:hypothetical protein